MKIFNWFLNLKTAVKLITAFLILALLQVGTGVVGLTQMNTLNHSISNMYNNNLKPIQEVAEAGFSPTIEIGQQGFVFDEDTTRNRKVS